MTPLDPMAALVEHGVLLQSARGPVPNVAELVAGEPIRGSWWGHPAHERIFTALNELADSPDVVRTRLVGGKVTLVHRRLWPALVRVGARFPPDRVMALREEHTPSGQHEVHAVPFPDWVPESARAAAAGLTEAEALAALPKCLRGATARGA